jgi:hypothetical protein
MTLEQIKELNYKILTDKQFKELNESELVTKCECNGGSGQNDGYMWYDFELADGNGIIADYKPTITESTKTLDDLEEYAREMGMSSRAIERLIDSTDTDGSGKLSDEVFYDICFSIKCEMEDSEA